MPIMIKYLQAIGDMAVNNNTVPTHLHLKIYEETDINLKITCINVHIL